MKAHVGKNGIAPWVLDEAVAEAMKQIDIQSNEISARCYNEMTIAMDQAGFSKDDICKVHKVLNDVILPKIKSVRDDEYAKNKDDNSQEISDSDIWMQMYCESHDLPYLECE